MPTWTPLARRGALRSVAVFAVILILVTAAWSQSLPFEPNVRVNDDQGVRNQFEPSLAVDGQGGVYVLWKDGNSWSSFVRFSLSRDWGQTWRPSQRDDDGFTYATDPVIFYADDGSLHQIRMAYNPDNRSQLSYQRSFDRGESWTPAIAANSTGGDPRNFLDREWLWVADHTVHVTYHIDNDVRYNNSTDLGETFNPSRRLNSGSPGWISGPVVVGPDGVVYVTWEDASRRIWFSKSLDGGLTFSTAQRVVDTYPHNFNNRPVEWVLHSMVCDRTGNVHIVWTEGRGRMDAPDPREHVWCITSPDGGQTWLDPVEINDDRSPSASPLSEDTGFSPGRYKVMAWACVDPQNRLHVTWYDHRFARWQIRHALSMDQGASFSANNLVSDADFDLDGRNYGDFMSCAADAQYVYAVWSDSRRGSNYDIYFSKAPLPP